MLQLSTNFYSQQCHQSKHYVLEMRDLSQIQGTAFRLNNVRNTVQDPAHLNIMNKKRTVISSEGKTWSSFHIRIAVRHNVFSCRSYLSVKKHAQPRPALAELQQPLNFKRSLIGTETQAKLYSCKHKLLSTQSLWVLMSADINERESATTLVHIQTHAVYNGSSYFRDLRFLSVVHLFFSFLSSYFKQSVLKLAQSPCTVKGTPLYQIQTMFDKKESSYKRDAVFFVLHFTKKSLDLIKIESLIVFLF